MDAPHTKKTEQRKIIWKKLTSPHPSITNRSEKRRARLVSSLLFFLSIGIGFGVVYMGKFSSSPKVGLVLIVFQILFVLTYFLSRTKYNLQSAIITTILLMLVPIFDVIFSNHLGSEMLLILLIWNIATILFSSAIYKLIATGYIAAINLLTILLLPSFFSNISYEKIAVPFIFNLLISSIIIIFTHHRNQLEKDHLSEISIMNNQLEFELEERKKIEEKLAHSAMHDPLTDLPNRTLFMDRLTHAKAYAKRHEDFTFAVCFIDLDRFKVINDSLGHRSGDLLIIESARRIKSCIRAADTVARLGGDEFVLLLEGAEDPDDYLHIVHRIQQKLALPVNLDDYTVYISISIGVVLETDRYETADEILRNADIAMYQTKKEGRGDYRIFDDSMLEGVMTRIEMENDLRKALDNHEFLLYYQPILNIISKEIIGFEALLRWQHPQKGLIYPNEFIEIIEEMGLIIPIGYWVLDEATRQIKEWQDKYQKDLSINVNLSTKQCSEKDLAEKIDEILRKNLLAPTSLKLELTESLIIKDTKAITVTLEKLRSLGVEVQIDDFGTGYSSLGYLHKLPIDTLKIDRTFVNRLGLDSSGSDIVQTILALAHGMGMHVIAEGVETELQLSILEQMQCEFVQGFLFAKPLNAQDAVKMLTK